MGYDDEVRARQFNGFFTRVRKMLSQHRPITSGFFGNVTEIGYFLNAFVLGTIVLNYVIYRVTVKTSLNFLLQKEK